MGNKAELQEHIVRSALDLAAERGWRPLTMTEIAGRAQVSLDELYDHFPTKWTLLCGLSRIIDRAMLASGPADPTESPRDRLFEVLMRRFDALTPYRLGVLAVLKDLPGDPGAALAQLFPLQLSMSWALELAGMPPQGLLGAAKVEVLKGLYLLVLRVWREDASADLGRTMAALDSRLRQAEQLANTFERRGRRPRHETPTAEAPPAPDTGAGEPAGAAKPQEGGEAPAPTRSLCCTAQKRLTFRQGGGTLTLRFGLRPSAANAK